MKGKGEEESYTHLNAEFQKLARRDRKTLLSSQCKKIEENNRMRKTRDLFKKIGNIKGIFHSKMGTREDRNGKNLIDQEEMARIHRRTVQERSK